MEDKSAMERIMQLGASHPQGFTAEVLQRELSGISDEAKALALNKLLEKRHVIALRVGDADVYKTQSKDEVTRFAGLTGPHILVYYMIQEAQASGMYLKDIKSKTGNPHAEKLVKKLEDRGIVKRVEGVRQKCYILSELTPSENLTGNVLYSGGIDLASLQETIFGFIRKKRIVTLKQLENACSANAQLSRKHYEQVISCLMLDGEVEEVRSTGIGEFASIPANSVCYKAKATKTTEPQSAFTSAPCGVCPVIRQCTPGGLISPQTCVYYDQWLRW